MISFFFMESRARPIVASLAFVGVAIAIQWCYLDPKASSGDKGEDQNGKTNGDEHDPRREPTIGEDVSVDGYDAENKKDEDDTTKEFLFPWEPNYVQNGRNNNCTKESRNADPEKNHLSGSPPMTASVRFPGRHGTRTTERSSMEELDFLASMTFANGGIRSPSCPCCV